jgi:hypothetical protein
MSIQLKHTRKLKSSYIEEEIWISSSIIFFEHNLILLFNYGLQFQGMKVLL